MSDTRFVAGLALACMLATGCSSSSHAGRAGGGADEVLRAQGAAPPGANAEPRSDLDFDLVNSMGTTIRAVYVSPSDSKGWEENVLGGDDLRDGDRADIRFSPEEGAALWDIRIESGNGRYCAEWKSLDLRGVSRITLLLKLGGAPVAVARVE